MFNETVVVLPPQKRPPHMHIPNIIFNYSFFDHHKAFWQRMMIQSELTKINSFPFSEILFSFGSATTTQSPNVFNRLSINPSR
jgi:hypothetical protein